MRTRGARERRKVEKNGTLHFHHFSFKNSHFGSGWGSRIKVKGIKAEKVYSVRLLQSGLCGEKESVWNGGAVFVFCAAVKCLRG